MQRLEVSGAVRHIYIIRRLKVKGRKLLKVTENGDDEDMWSELRK
jgi:hypothetical protein